ncbi:PhzF family phenazine biosynthesis protein [Pseudonocardia abyssalis]|jgi:trans-2,3-dihydro-3-hydroxyanthranilate isomerase|uniref:PhzF family phenazine biosynthesis protein n=1 Tax=Pseudonocardia abyssalis TaxID=2792008 RepID=A0ABS6UWR1_9PSEU|nr:PhzF family phenazine biosynthesis protein [Pseudonocardia abyssalis]MBW0115683.1 PhzF family phenazine biosynthesis protein [Pseudonocardia abyssalis]MBW0136421.1 PhzF family phenazine biosynthesis protein [Pseudonocardia abyssalis]
MIPLRYDVVDVFTDRAYAGNPLAVVHGAHGLTAGQMQAIAGEFNLSETAFPLPPTGGADYRLRIFTPGRELPFAGHPSVGAAWVLARDGLISTGEVVQECGAGLLPVRVDDHGAQVTGGASEVGPSLDGDALAAAVGLAAADVDAAVPAGVAGAGVPYAYVVVRPDAVARAVPDPTAVRALTDGLVGLVVVSFDAGASAAHMRMFAPDVGVTEDPATGSAAVALAVFLVDRGVLAADGQSGFTVAQGAEIGRPSTLGVLVHADAGAAVRTSVRGTVRPVARGELVASPPL